MDSPLIKQQCTIFDFQHYAPIWSVFNTQNEAFEVCKHAKKSLNQDLQIFSQEIYYDNIYGKRKYIATNYIHFFKKYKSMKQEERCYYEVIREGFKCKLYFDIEYETEYNPSIDGDELMIIFKDFLIEYIAKECSIDISKSNIIDLDSTTNTKFSRHLIIIFPVNAVFKNNEQCGIFVRKMCDEIRKIAKKGLHHFSETPITDKGHHLNKLFIYKTDPKNCKEYDRVLFVDEAVYTKNRCFRIIYSSKLKNIHKYGGTFIGYHPNQERKIKSSTFKEKFMAFMDTLICTVNVDEDTRIIEYPGHRYSYKMSFQGHNTELQSGYKASPFPALDEWMTNLINHWSRCTAPWVYGMNKIPTDITSDSPLYDAKPNKGKITKWMLFKDNHNDVSSITYSVDKNRFCMNVARCHKSNGIYFVVKFKKKVVQQKCFDPQCRTFISPDIDIPSYLLELGVEDQDFELKLIESCNKIERRIEEKDIYVIQEENTGNVDDVLCLSEKQNDEPSYSLGNESFDLKMLELVTEMEQNVHDNLNKTNEENGNEEDEYNGEKEETPLIYNILFKTPASTICNKSVKSMICNGSKKALKKNLNHLFVDIDIEKESENDKKQSEHFVRLDLDFEFDDEWDDEFIQKLDKQLQNVT